MLLMVCFTVILSLFVSIYFFVLSPNNEEKLNVIEKGGDNMDNKTSITPTTSSPITRFTIAITISVLTAIPAFYYTWGLYRENVYLPWFVMVYIIIFTTLLIGIMWITEKMFRNNIKCIDNEDS